MSPMPTLRRQRGATLMEVLITMVILAFGLLGIAAFQSKAQVGSVESYQRAQAIILLEDMSSRLTGNSVNAASYVANVGTGDTQPANCGTATTAAARDLCEWSAALKGAAEVDASGARVGAMIGARGCITLVQAADPTTGICRPPIYQVAVAWQGLHQTQAPSVACGANQYGADTYRRAVSARVTVGLTTCSL